MLKESDKPASSGYLITCDIPTKQFIVHMNDTKPVDKKFIIKDLDATHLLVQHKAKAEITRKVDEWMDEVCLPVAMACFQVQLYHSTMANPPLRSECIL